MGLGGHETPQPQPSQIHTRANKGLEQVPIHEELVKMNKDLLTMVAQVKEYQRRLHSTGCTGRQRQAKLHTLIVTTCCAPLPKGIRAVATLLEHEEAACTADIIAAIVLCKIDLVLDLMGKVADQAQDAASDTRMVADRLSRTGEEMRDELQKGMDMAKEDIQRATECFKDKVSKLNEATVMAPIRIGNMRGHVRVCPIQCPSNHDQPKPYPPSKLTLSSKLR